MGRTVVVRDSYASEAKKLDWTRKSIEKDSRIGEDFRSEILPIIDLLHHALINLQLEIEKQDAQPVSSDAGQICH